MRHAVGMMALVGMALACGGAGGAEEEDAPLEAPVDGEAPAADEDEAGEGEGEGDGEEGGEGDAAVDAVRVVYDRYQTDDSPTRKDLPLSSDLIQLWKKHRDAVDFDPVIDGQDYEVSEIEATRDGDDVVVRFKNFDEDVEIRWVMIEEGGSWVATDIRSKEWSLRELLEK